MKLSEIVGAFSISFMRQYSQHIKDKYKLINFQLLYTSGSFDLIIFVVPKEKRKTGVGSQVMQELCAFADQHQKKILLTPMHKDKFYGTTSYQRLVKFYQRFGFVENSGNNKEEKINAAMYRKPIKNNQLP